MSSPEEIKSEIRRITRCRVCNGKSLTMIVELGETPLANAYLSHPRDAEKWFPLQLYFCNMCSLVQLGHVVDPQLMFRTYSYRSSGSLTIPLHFKELAEDFVSSYLRSSKDLVVEIGSNDGTLLGAFKALNVRAIGIDPAANLAKIANKRGLETIPEFFNDETAHQLRARRGRARAVIANNVFAHVDDLHAFLGAIGVLLADDGILLLEFPYLGDLNQSVEYDTIYHEHLSYFSINPISRLLSEFGFSLVSVTKIEVHGGSVRVIAQKGTRVRKIPFLDLEKKSGLDKLETYQSLAGRIEYQKECLKQMLKQIKHKGHRIVGYGAPAKGNTLLNVCGIGPETVDYLIDTTPEKQGKFTPGTHIPIREASGFSHEEAPFTLMLAWNYEKEIILKEREYEGQFIVPIPYPRILPKN